MSYASLRACISEATCAENKFTNVDRNAREKKDNAFRFPACFPLPIRCTFFTFHRFNISPSVSSLLLLDLHYYLCCTNVKSLPVCMKWKTMLNERVLRWYHWRLITNIWCLAFFAGFVVQYDRYAADVNTSHIPKRHINSMNFKLSSVNLSVSFSPFRHNFYI